jgi:ferredoxin
MKIIFIEIIRIIHVWTASVVYSISIWGIVLHLCHGVGNCVEGCPSRGTPTSVYSEGSVYMANTLVGLLYR